MDVPEPEQTPFTALTQHTSRLHRVSLSPSGHARRHCWLARLMAVAGGFFVLTQPAPDIPILPRCHDSLRGLSLGRLRRASPLFLPADRSRTGVVHWYVDGVLYIQLGSGTRQDQLTICDYCSRLHPRHLPPQPLPGLPNPQIRPVAHPRRRPGGRRRRQPAHKAGRRVPALCAPSPRVQVLALGHPRHHHRLRVHLVHRL